jgi:hypothetical protein
VPFLGGSDEIVVGSIERGRHAAELGRVAVGELARRDAFLARGLQHLDAVLVGAGQEEHVLAVEPLEAGKGIGGDQFIGMADMRLAVRIGDRGRDVECVA